MIPVTSERNFGDGRLVGDDNDDLVIPETYEELARMLAFSNGCPVAERLIDERGAEQMASRYAQVNFWYGYALNEIDKINPEIAESINRPQQRLPDEPIGKHDAESIPADAEHFMIGLNSPVGYALPRMIIEFLNSPEDNEDYIRRMRIVDKAIQGALLTERVNGSESFTVEFAEKLFIAIVSEGREPYVFLKQLIGLGKLEEDNCHTIYKRLFELITNNTYHMADFLHTMSDEDFRHHRIANMRDYIRPY